MGLCLEQLLREKNYPEWSCTVNERKLKGFLKDIFGFHQRETDSGQLLNTRCKHPVPKACSQCSSGESKCILHWGIFSVPLVKSCTASGGGVLGCGGVWSGFTFDFSLAAQAHPSAPQRRSPVWGLCAQGLCLATLPPV